MIKKLFTKAGWVKDEETIGEHTHSIKILKWLKEIGGSWTRRKTNPNCFYSDRLESIYVYENEIRYWEDIRVQIAYEVFPIPKTKLHLEKYLTEEIEDKIKTH